MLNKTEQVLAQHMKDEKPDTNLHHYTYFLEQWEHDVEAVYEACQEIGKGRPEGIPERDEFRQACGFYD